MALIEPIDNTMQSYSIVNINSGVTVTVTVARLDVDQQVVDHDVICFNHQFENGSILVHL